MTRLTVVMYHYVRPLARTPYPDIKGLDLALFDAQLDYLQAHYSPVSMEQVVAALDGQARLPERPVLLTFDDGYLDHFTYVFPRLVQRGLRGAFFPPAEAILRRKMLDVNKIHFLLASKVEISELVAQMEAAVLDATQEFALASLGELREQYRQPGRFDSAEVIYVKRLLQHALPDALRHRLVADLFAQHVSSDETAFAESLYVSEEQLRTMVSSGQHVGSHGSAHCWLSRLSAERQREDIEQSLDLLERVGADAACRTICYPYGDYDATTLDILRTLGFKAGLTTKPELVPIGAARRLELARLDTNDLPKARDAQPSAWTVAAVAA